MSNSVVDEKDDFDVEDIYTPLEVAKEEIWKRWNDKELRKKVEKYLDNSIPFFLEKEPRAVMVRQIASPNMELHRFLDLAKKSNLKPVINEYTNDKFVSINSYKFSLGKLSFFHKFDKKNCPILRCVRIIDIDSSENKELSNIDTFHGINLVDFHHNMLKNSVPEFNDEYLIDISDWCRNNGGRAERYYYNFLVWFICNGVLFENFLTHKNESNFTKNIVLPAFRKIKDEFGLKPLIVPIVKNSEAEDIFWRSYNIELGIEFFK